MTDLTPEKLDELERIAKMWAERGAVLDWRDREAMYGALPALIAAARERDRLLAGDHECCVEFEAAERDAKVLRRLEERAARNPASWGMVTRWIAEAREETDAE